MATRFTKVFDSRDHENSGVLDTMVYEWVPGTYATGGQKFDLDAAVSESAAADAGLDYQGEVVAVDCYDGGGAGYSVQYDAGDGKLLIFVAAGTQVPNATDLSAVTLGLRIIGKTNANPGTPASA